MCVHALCAVQTQGILDKFLKWRQKSKLEVNLTSLVMGGIQSGHKGKVAKPRKGSYTPLNKEIQVEQEVSRQPLVPDSSIKETLDSLGSTDEDHPFEIIYLYQTKASLFYGCGTEFVREIEQNYFILRYYCKREYLVKGETKSKWQFAYFHVKSSCVRQNFANFKKAMLIASDECKTIIQAEVKDGLAQVGVII
ncbi:unnamed protein product [Mytilus coruscus]|uniref:Uncharacterized protein n=1 Tax=Mytilus coruscus TaxID=42192 RepID=A0A6J8C162_MYTCO|nr:unnamed protein product [Mytilus coruscus]